MFERTIHWRWPRRSVLFWAYVAKPSPESTHLPLRGQDYLCHLGEYLSAMWRGSSGGGKGREQHCMWKRQNGESERKRDKRSDYSTHAFFSLFLSSVLCFSVLWQSSSAMAPNIVLLFRGLVFTSVRCFLFSCPELFSMLLNCLILKLQLLRYFKIL